MGVRLLPCAATSTRLPEVIAGAILDRLLHHRQLVAINGPSYRTPDLTGALEAFRTRE